MPTMVQVVIFLSRASVICLLVGWIGRMIHLQIRSNRQARLDKISQRKEITAWQTFFWLCLFFCALSIVLTLDFDYDAKPDDAIAVTEFFAAVIGTFGSAVLTIIGLIKADPDADVSKSGTLWFFMLFGLGSLALLIYHLLTLHDHRVWPLVRITVVFGAAFGLVFKRPFTPRFRSGFDYLARLGLVLLAALVLVTVYLTIKNLTN